MRHVLLLVLTGLLLSSPNLFAAEDHLTALEATVQDRDRLQPGLETYIVTVETAKVSEMIQKMTASMPPDVPRPQAPEITKYWQRSNGRSLVLAKSSQAMPYVEQMIERFSSTLAVALDDLLMPAETSSLRRRLTSGATVKMAETALAGQVLQQIDITFAEPVDLGDAFYRSGLRLPRKQVSTLHFDIDKQSATVTELDVTTADGTTLTVEFRYRTVPGGHLPERIHTTSPDGRIDDLFEVTFAETGGFILPLRMVRTLRRPDLTDDLDVSFNNYRINQPLPEEIRIRLDQAE